MGEKAAKRCSWWLPISGLVGAAIVVLPEMILGNGFGTFLATIVIGALIGLTVLLVLILNIRRHCLAALSMVAVFGAGSWLLLKISGDVHTTGRWLIQSGKYKAEILAQPNPPSRELKHAEWDAWGIAGMDTVAYLVFDPNDSLRGAAQNRSAGKFPGIPCKVANVRRLEQRWYEVWFYTNTDWKYCS